MERIGEIELSYGLMCELGSLWFVCGSSKPRLLSVAGVNCPRAQAGRGNLAAGGLSRAPTAGAGSSDSGTEMQDPPALLERTRKRSAVPEGEVLTHFRPL